MLFPENGLSALFYNIYLELLRQKYIKQYWTWVQIFKEYFDTKKNHCNRPIAQCATHLHAHLHFAIFGVKTYTCLHTFEQCVSTISAFLGEYIPFVHVLTHTMADRRCAHMCAACFARGL